MWSFRTTGWRISGHHARVRRHAVTSRRAHIKSFKTLRAAGRRGWRSPAGLKSWMLLLLSSPFRWSGTLRAPLSGLAVLADTAATCDQMSADYQLWAHTADITPPRHPTTELIISACGVQPTEISSCVSLANLNISANALIGVVALPNDLHALSKLEVRSILCLLQRATRFCCGE